MIIDFERRLLFFNFVTIDLTYNERYLYELLLITKLFNFLYVKIEKISRLKYFTLNFT